MNRMLAPFLWAVTEYLTEQLIKKGFVWANSLLVKSIVVGKSWHPELQAVDPIAAEEL